MRAEGGRFYSCPERFLRRENVTAHSDQIHARFEPPGSVPGQVGKLCIAPVLPPNLDSRDSGA